MKIKYVFIALILFLSSCKESKVNHLGDKKKEVSITMDSLVLNASFSSGRGNFYAVDSIMTFVDIYYSTFYNFSINNGTLLGKQFSRGNGPNELSSILYAYPIVNKDKECLIVDNSMSIIKFDEKNELDRLGLMDFGWTNQASSDYNSPSNYNLQFMSDFGIDFHYLNDSTILFPVNIIPRYTSPDGYIQKKHYKKGHIWGEMNLKTMKVERVQGQFPEIYKNYPTPHLEFFQYAMNKDTAYVNHTVDSLIYAYIYPDKKLFTMGYEGVDIDRNYTKTSIIDEGQTFRKDMPNIGLYTGLKYIHDTGLLFRTYLKNVSTGKTGLQIYKNQDLIADLDMPDYFKFLHFYNGVYYGVRFLPVETEDETFFVLYKFKISEHKNR